MERRLNETIGNKHLLLIMIIGLLISCVSILMGVDSLYQNYQYLQLGITAGLFVFLVVMIRHMKLKYESLNKIEVEQIHEQ